MRRVVVTGIGVVSALGLNMKEHCDALKSGKSGIAPMSLIDTDGLTINIAAEAKEFDGSNYFSRSEMVMRDRVTQMALVAAKEAVAMSKIEFNDETALTAATIIGTSMGGQHTQDDNYKAIYAEGKTRVHPFTVPKLMTNASASHISMTYGLKGPAFTVATACASSNHAIGQAFHLIRNGMTNIAITGGTESGLTFGVMKAWEGLRVMSKDTCRPFSKTRTGMVQGEGSAILVIEELEHAIARNAPIYGEIVGFGMTADATDIVQPSQEGAERAMNIALKDASIKPTDVGYVNAHGTATAANDKTETTAIKNVYGDHAHSLSISSTKSMHGHCIGAAGALEMVATLMALHDGIIPPTIGYEEEDPDCDLDITPNVAVEKNITYAMSNSFAFGGLNAVLVAKKYSA